MYKFSSINVFSVSEIQFSCFSVFMCFKVDSVFFVSIFNLLLKKCWLIFNYLCCFYFIFLILDIKFLQLGSDNMVDIISYFYNLLGLDLWPSIRFALESVPCTLIDDTCFQEFQVVVFLKTKHFGGQLFYLRFSFLNSRKRTIETCGVFIYLLCIEFIGMVLQNKSINVSSVQFYQTLLVYIIVFSLSKVKSINNSINN